MIRLPRSEGTGRGAGAGEIGSLPSAGIPGPLIVMRGSATITPPAAPALVQSVALRRRGSSSKTVPLVQSHAVPKPDALLSAVVVSGGKQYRVAPGDKILVDRLTAEPGTSLKLDRVLLLRNGDDITVGSPGVDGLDVEVKVLQHRRGPRLESLRYKSKKRVRVHHGGRADLTALEIIAVGGFTGETKKEKAADDKPKAKAPVRPRAKAAVKAEAAAPAAEDKPVKRAPRKREAK